MTPAEQLRATMALLEAIAESKDGDKIIDQLISSLPDSDSEELSEGRFTSALAGLAVTAAMAMGNSAAAGTLDQHVKNPARSAECAGMLASTVKDIAKSDPAQAERVQKAASNLAQAAIQGGMDPNEVRGVADRAANNLLVQLNAGTLENGQRNVRNLLQRCVNFVKTGVLRTDQENKFWADKEAAEKAAQERGQAQQAARVDARQAAGAQQRADFEAYQKELRDRAEKQRADDQARAAAARDAEQKRWDSLTPQQQAQEKQNQAEQARWEGQQAGERAWKGWLSMVRSFNSQAEARQYAESIHMGLSPEAKKVFAAKYNDFRARADQMRAQTQGR